ncbi:MAG: peptidoglycan DD-metalloendopeptidase family protein [Clostridia bacterium]|nr:peptidoglycan DD-metalloendopeptidase family protein [Clostridia bacterium]
MKKRKLRICLIALLLAAACVSSCLFVPSSAEGSDAKVQSYEEQMQDLQKKQEEAQARIDQTKNDLSNAVEYKRAIDETLEVTYSKVALAQDMLAELDVKIADKEAEIVKQTEIISERREQFKKRMVSIADDGSFSNLSLLLSAGSMTEFLTIYDSVSSILAYDKRVMNELETAKAALVSAKDELEAAKVAQESALTELQNSTEYFNQLSLESSNAINALSKNEAEFEQTYQYYQAQEQQIAAELQAYVKELQAQQEQQAQQQQQAPVYYGDGTYMWPLDGYTTVSSGFGNRYIEQYGLSGFHRGIDIPAPAGTPIHACSSGTVIRSEFHYSWGNYVLVDHGGGYSTLYAHMTTRSVSAGQVVSKGETLGTVGQTGHAYGDHLHLEYWINGEVCDPTQMFY